MSVASVVHQEVQSLRTSPEAKGVFGAIPIPIHDYVEEMAAYQEWLDRHRDADRDPVQVRVQVMTELYVGFVWLRDAIVEPLVAALPSGSTLTKVHSFFGSGDRRRFRNAIAHGRWHYLPDFSGIRCWDGPRGRRLSSHIISQDQYDGWLVLSRGTSIAAMLALTADPID